MIAAVDAFIDDEQQVLQRFIAVQRRRWGDVRRNAYPDPGYGPSLGFRRLVHADAAVSPCSRARISSMGTGLPM